MLTVKTIIETIYEKWSQAVSSKVGTNYFMENSATISKFPAATCYFIGLPGSSWDLEGNEGTVNATIQVDIYANGRKGLSKVYDIDEISHQSLTKCGFRRNYGPELIQASDPSIRRLTSRYNRVIGYGDSL